jgi:hypothetical protein
MLEFASKSLREPSQPSSVEDVEKGRKCCPAKRIEGTRQLALGVLSPVMTSQIN